MGTHAVISSGKSTGLEVETGACVQTWAHNDPENKVRASVSLSDSFTFFGH
jgi:hypothetical protein